MNVPRTPRNNAIMVIVEIILYANGALSLNGMERSTLACGAPYR